MAKSRTELWAEAFFRRKVERYLKERITNFCSGFSVEDLRYAAQNNINVISSFLKPVEQKWRQKKASPFKHLVVNATVDDFIRLFEEVSPQHAAILREYRSWTAQGLEIAKRDIFGD